MSYPSELLDQLAKHNISVYLACLFDVLIYRNVYAEVVHLEAIGGKHRGYKRLADVVDVAFDGSDDHFAGNLALCAALCHLRLQDGYRSLHGFASQDQIGQEHLATTELLTDVIYTGDKALVDGDKRINSLGKGALRQSFRLFRLTVDDALCHGFEQFFGHFSS